MTKEEESTLKRFETRVRQLLMQHRQLQEDYLQLAVALEEKEAALAKAGEENRKLRDDYAHLKLAKMMEISNEDLKEAKHRVELLVRKVDKCIALLGV